MILATSTIKGIDRHAARRVLGLLALVATTVVPPWVEAQTSTSTSGNFGVANSPSSSGGGKSQGGTFSISGSIGQPATDTLKGGSFMLVGGLLRNLIDSTVGGPAILSVAIDAAGQAVLQWDQSGYLLEFRDALSGPAAWQPVTPNLTDRIYLASATLPARFFRLRKP